MRLKNPNQSVPGGFRYKVPETGHTVSTDGSLKKLILAVKAYYQLKELPEPTNLGYMIEDYVCSYAPKKFCRGSGLGDAIHFVALAVAGVVDAIVGTDLKTKAKKCGACGKRRTTLNKITTFR